MGAQLPELLHVVCHLLRWRQVVHMIHDFSSETKDIGLKWCSLWSCSFRSQSVVGLGPVDGVSIRSSDELLQQVLNVPAQPLVLLLQIEHLVHQQQHHTQWDVIIHLDAQDTVLPTKQREEINIYQESCRLTLSSSWAETRQCSGSMSDLGSRGGTWNHTNQYSCQRLCLMTFINIKQHIWLTFYSTRSENCRETSSDKRTSLEHTLRMDCLMSWPSRSDMRPMLFIPSARLSGRAFTALDTFLMELRRGFTNVSIWRRKTNKQI